MNIKQQLEQVIAEMDEAVAKVAACEISIIGTDCIQDWSSRLSTIVEQVPDGMVPTKTVLEWVEEAKEDIQDWACYAPEYFREKHNLAADLVKMDARIAELRRIAAAEKPE